MNSYQIDRLFRGFFYLSGGLSIAILLGIFVMLLVNGMLAFKDISIWEFFTSSHWMPSAYEKPRYGILALVTSSLLVTGLTMIMVVPVGVGTAAYLAEYAPVRLTKFVKPAIEMLAAVPSVTLGFIGIVLIGPFLADLFGTTHGLHALNGAVLLAIMALPTVVSVSEDAIHAVPRAYKEGAYALGANKWETLVRVIIPAAKSGIITGIMLGMGRAIGETMAVLMATGNAVAMPDGIFSSVQPITATIAIEMGEVPYNTPHYYSLFALGIILFLITLIINWLSDWVSGSQTS